jgi:type I restriction enzyme S subunit
MNLYPSYRDCDLFWIDIVPTHWSKTKNKHIFIEKDSTVGEHWENYPLLSLTKKGVILRDMESGKGKFPESFDNYKVVDTNDLIFCLYDIEETPRTIGFSELNGMITGSYKIIECKDVNTKFIYYYYLNIDDFKGLKPYYTGLRNVVRPETFRGLQINLPPLPEQTQIVSFLDTKTQKIDELIEKTEQKIELLKEKRTSLINHCVTKGLNPNVGMKDSGVEWIGEIPSHWILNKVGNNTYVKGRIGWKGLRSEDFIDEGPYLITGTDFNSDGTINWNNMYHVDQQRYDEDPFIQLKDNDVLITKDGTIGKVVHVGNLKGQTCLNSGIFLTRPTNNQYVSRFFFWMLKSNVFKIFVDYNSGGSTIQHLYQNVFINLKFPIPPLEEQTQIIEYLDDQTQKIDTTIEKETQRIELLKEYRQSLISEVVTGKVDVRGWNGN